MNDSGDSNERGDWAIIGKAGHIYADGSGFLLYVATDESPRRWGFLKKAAFILPRDADGDDEAACTSAISRRRLSAG